MDYKLGLRTLKSQLPAEARAELYILEARLLDNLRRERLYGSTETTRAERSGVVDPLNQLAQAYLDVSFNDLCMPGGNMPDTGSENSLLRQVWDILEPELQDALALAYNQACREGKNTIKTRYLFAAIARLKPERLKGLIEYIPSNALPQPTKWEVTTERVILSENPDLSPCVEGSLKHLAMRANSQRKISGADLFVDIARHGTGSSVASLRAAGVTPEKIDEIIEQLELDIIGRE